MDPKHKKKPDPNSSFQESWFRIQPSRKKNRQKLGVSFSKKISVLTYIHVSAPVVNYGLPAVHAALPAIHHAALPATYAALPAIHHAALPAIHALPAAAPAISYSLGGVPFVVPAVAAAPAEEAAEEPAVEEAAEE